jgi:hypothetical protein
MRTAPARGRPKLARVAKASGSDAAVITKTTTPNTVAIIGDANRRRQPLPALTRALTRLVPPGC